MEGLKIRKNNKELVIDYESSIKKSNEFSMAKLNHGLTLNQMQLLAYAIYSTQRESEKNLFIKADFEKKFGLKEYRTEHANEDTRKLYELGFATVNLEEAEFDYLRVFQRITYKKGTFTFKWTDDMLPHILELKDNYVTTDLFITSKFRSSFTWTLYDYLKAHYGYWYKDLTKESLMRLFGVDGVKSYQNNTALLKARVLDLAIKEINEYTEFKVWYTEEKKGRAIVGFVLHWSTGEKIAAATDGQINLLRGICDTVINDMMKYLAIKDNQWLAEARTHLIALNEIGTKISSDLTAKDANLHIQNAKYHFNRLEKITELDKQGKPVFYNWLDERES